MFDSIGLLALVDGEGGKSCFLHVLTLSCTVLMSFCSRYFTSNSFSSGTLLGTVKSISMRSSGESEWGSFFLGRVPTGGGIGVLETVGGSDLTYTIDSLTTSMVSSKFELQRMFFGRLFLIGRGDTRLWERRRLVEDCIVTTGGGLEEEEEGVRDVVFDVLGGVGGAGLRESRQEAELEVF